MLYPLTYYVMTDISELILEILWRNFTVFSSSKKA